MKALPAQPSLYLSPGSIRGTQETNLAPLGSRARGTHRAEAGAVLRAAACRAAPSGRSQRPVAIARVHTGLGRQLDLGLFPGLRLARSPRRAAAGGGELCPQPEPVLRATTVCGPWGRRMVAAGSTGGSRLRSRRQRFAISRIISRCASLAGVCLRLSLSRSLPTGSCRW